MRYTVFFTIWIVLTFCLPNTKKEEPLPQTKASEREETFCPKNEIDFQNIFFINEKENIEKKVALRAKYYLTTNERRLDVFYPFVKNLRGGYVGVGTDQNLILISWVKPDYAYLIDFDYIAVSINQLHLLFLSHSHNFIDFKSFWLKKNQKKGIELIQKTFLDEEEQKIFLKVYKMGLNVLPERFQELEILSKKFTLISYHNNQEDFEFLKNLIQKNRIQALLGDINGNVIFRKIGDASKKLCIPIRTIYLSNAEEYYRYPQSFRENIFNLSIDESSLIVRTVTSGALEFGFPEFEKYKEIPFHYNIQKVQDLLDWFTEDQLWIYTMLKSRTDIQKGISFLGKKPIKNANL
ncbi:MAG: hypothetical protein ACK4UJ_08405 [Leptonema sp. (in: bacteria)]